jgi:hypothetical protein
MNSIPFKVFSKAVFINAMASLFLNWKIAMWFSFVLHESADPFWTRTRCQYFWAKWMDPPPKCLCRLEVGQVSQFSWWYRFAELQTIRGNWIMVWRVRRKQIRCRMTEPPGFSDRQLISTIALDTSCSESRVIYQNTYSRYKIISHNDQLIELELINDCISRNPVLNDTSHCQNAHRVSLHLRTQ